MQCDERGGRPAACPHDTEWVLLTNGDNEYASSFFSRVGEVKEADIVAVDFYSRYQRITGMHSLGVLRPVVSRMPITPSQPPCDRIAGWASGPAPKK